MGCHDSKNRIQVCKNTVGKKILTDFAESKQYKYNRTVMRKRGHMRKTEAMINEIEKVIIGKREVIEQVLMTILAKGHVLLEDIPGVGKTTLALSFAKVMGVDYHRIQFTPDVTPSDVVGFSLYDRQSGEFQYKPGAVMCNLLLADEINRTSSKTQAALLEVMEEGNATVDGKTYEIPKPFTVIATQNPFGSAGTQMLPQSQMDRFMVKLSMGYPDFESQINILRDRQTEQPLDLLQMISSREEVQQLQQEVKEVEVADDILRYITLLVEATRQNDKIQLGVSPRGALALNNMAKASAYINGRDYVIPDDVLRVFAKVCAHRVILHPRAKVAGIQAEEIMEQITHQVSIPEITTTFGPAMVYVASDHAGVDVTTDNGEAAFKALADLKPNLVKTYTKSSDLINMFTSGEVAAAVVGDFGVPTIVAANPTLVYVTPDGAYANFNTINVTKNCANKELAYEYINYRISEELQTKTGKALNEAPTNMDVTFTEEESKDMTYGDKAAKVKVVDYAFVNPILNNWIDQWNRTINN